MAYQIAIDNGTLVITMTGTLTRSDLEALATDVITLERDGTYTPSRVADMRDLADIAIGFPEMSRFAEISRNRPLERPVRTGIVVANTLQRGFARMFQILNEHPQVTVAIFDDATVARAWVESGGPAVEAVPDPSSPSTGKVGSNP